MCHCTLNCFLNHVLKILHYWTILFITKNTICIKRQLLFRVKDLKKKTLEKELTISRKVVFLWQTKKSHLDLLTINLLWVMFCLAIASGLYGRGVKSIRSFCPLELPLPTQAVETLQGFYAFFYLNRGEIAFQFLMSYWKSVVPGYEKALLKLSYVLLNLLDFLFIQSYIMPLKGKKKKKTGRDVSKSPFALPGRINYKCVNIDRLINLSSLSLKIYSTGNCIATPTNPINVP